MAIDKGENGMSLKEIKRSPIAFAEEILGCGLFEFQKTFIKNILKGEKVSIAFMRGKSQITKLIEEISKS